MLVQNSIESLQQRVADAMRRLESLEAKYETTTIGQLASMAARTHGSTTAIDIFERGERATYSEIDRWSNQYARALRTFGVRKGDRIGVMLPNRIEFPILFFALAKLGAVLVSINLRDTPREVGYVLGDTQAKFAVVDESAWPVFSAMDPWPKDLLRERVISVAQSPRLMTTALESLVEGADESPVHEDVHPDDVLTIAYTSGTTGLPKGFPATHDYWGISSYINAHLDYHPYKRYLSWSPLFYSWGHGQVLRSYRQGGTLYQAQQLSSTRFVEWIDKYRIEWCSMPELIAGQPEADALKRLKQVGHYLGWSPESIQQFRERFGVRGQNNYGMTEIGNSTSFLGDFPELEQAGSVGHRAPFRELRLVNDDGSSTPVGEVGELWVRGRAICKGYWNNAEANPDLLNDGWFKTGDLLRCNELGFYWYIGRKKDTFKRSGENISAREVEAVIREIPEIAEVAAVPVKDIKRGEEVKIYVELKEGLTPADLPVERILEHARARLAAFKVPRYISFIRELPRTVTSNKVLKRELMAVSDPLAGSYDAEEKRWH